MEDQQTNRAQSSGRDERVVQAMEALGIAFRRPDLLRQALTHLSYVYERSRSTQAAVEEANERLEFLGDAVLELLVSEFLYRRFPTASEGELTAYRAALVRTPTLARWARRFRLDEFLYLGRSEVPRPGRPVRERILAGAFEAVLGALYLDRGIRVVRRFLHRLLLEEAEGLIAIGQNENYKGRLQELIQDRLRITPVYRTIAVTGPAHQRTFTAEVLIGERPYGVGHGPSKRAAEQEAARRALERLRAEGIG
ncbi:MULTISPECIES: ribonuclease III [Thermomicrobium]|jgi:ribonuclease-3|uniref:Ribonuclease 3 n=1 Tax=Thermomicrobium roseum (strain ATCC 27502 / DSM 5159 / P-2) TaxID=309801 RepID=B9L2H4_THERP|nr:MULTISPECIES: ribonuclease III [Thermomicrobium]ACM05802.1 ribonuclease III [Thermomicrobium roseum DSM 5159]MBO9307938.1 ribonuclease III [Thermomicrobium sp.]MBO9405489.1 ribonuclease III [Thermomicrobium sp.]